MPISTRTRFEVFKRDDFTCRYCGLHSPEVVLEVDHIVPLCEGGSDDFVNLATSCWDCNRGKAGVPLDQFMTGEDPYEAAIALLEKERQLREYNEVLEMERDRRVEDHNELVDYWRKKAERRIRWSDSNWLFETLKYIPREVIRDAMDAAIRNRKTTGLAYVCAVTKRWREENAQ